MHPVIRLVSFMMLSLALAVGGWLHLLLGALVAAVLFARAGAAAWVTIMPMMRRMRWLWLSLVVIYFWFTPGVAVVPVPDTWAAWVPTAEGLAQNTLRIATHTKKKKTAGLLLHLTSREQLFAALHWLTAPLGLFGVTHKRVAVRVALTLAAVAEVRSEVQEKPSREERPHTRWTRWGDRVASLFRTVVSRAETASCDEMELSPRPAPPLRQWLWPIALGAVMLAAAAVTR